MKKICYLALMLMFAACRSTQPTPPTQEEVVELIAAIPDHEFVSNTKEAYTSEYYTQLSRAWAVPSDAIGEIGTDEWLYYFISGNGGCEDFRIENINILTHHRRSTVRFVVFECGSSNSHTMELKYDKKAWRIADYDNTLRQLKEYLHEQRKYFKSAEWQAYLNAAKTDPLTANMANEREEEVHKWLK